MSIFINFFKTTIAQFLQIAVSVFLLSILFISSSLALPSALIEKLVNILLQQPFEIGFIFFKIFFFLFILSGFLFLIFSNFQTKWKIICTFVFVFILIFRLILLYPSVSDAWILFNQYPCILNTLQILSKYKFIVHLVDWLPFIFVASALLINLSLSIVSLLQKSQILYETIPNNNREILEHFSEKYSQKGLLLFTTVILGGFFLFSLVPKLNLSLPVNKMRTEKPHVFMFVVDSFRYDRITDDKYSNVMPFLRSQAKEAEVFAPLLASHSNTRKSWQDILYGEFILENSQTNTQITSNQQSSLEYPFFQNVRSAGYKTLFVSDFLNAKNIIEKKVISAIPGLLSILILPKWQRFSPVLFEIPLPEDPRLLGRVFNNHLANNVYQDKPLFITTFFSLDTIGFEEYSEQHIENLYNLSLQSIDRTIEKLFVELHAKGWTKNSIILVFGTHGQSLYDKYTRQNLKINIGNEKEFLAPFFLFSYQIDTSNSKLNSKHQIVRTIDIAPSLFQKLLISNKNLDFKGVSLYSFENPVKNTLDVNVSYQESSQTLLKERAWVNSDYKLILISSRKGIIPHLFLREDQYSQDNLLLKNNLFYQDIAQNMISQINNFLSNENVEIVQNEKNRFFYTDCAEQ